MGSFGMRSSRRTTSIGGLPTPDEAARIAAEQRQKRSDLDNYVNQANAKVNEINEINSKIDQANSCASQVRPIPGIIGGACATMGSVGSALQSGLSINGTPVGINVSNDSVSIKGNADGGVEAIISKVQEYCTRKNQEGNQKKQEAEQIRTLYENRLASYPEDLGPYGPAPTFPDIPEVHNFGG